MVSDCFVFAETDFKPIKNFSTNFGHQWRHQQSGIFFSYHYGYNKQLCLNELFDSVHLFLFQSFIFPQNDLRLENP